MLKVKVQSKNISINNMAPDLEPGATNYENLLRRIYQKV